LAPDNPEYLSSRCRAHIALPNLQQAAKDCEDAIRATKACADCAANGLAYLARGMLHMRNAKFKDAEKDFDEAIELMPDAPSGYLRRGEAYEKLNQRSKAIADYRTAAAMEPETTQDLKDKQAALAALRRLGASATAPEPPAGRRQRK
jgi:tetratricopeptide (TPR) repeat protein